MMKYCKNEYGSLIIAVGQEDSLARIKECYPDTIKLLKDSYIYARKMYSSDHNDPRNRCLFPAIFEMGNIQKEYRAEITKALIDVLREEFSIAKK
jgi:hypothetical protein